MRGNFRTSKDFLKEGHMGKSLEVNSEGRTEDAGEVKELMQVLGTKEERET